MTVTVRYFASLRERLGRDEDRLELPAPASARDVWVQVADGETLPTQVLVAINQEFAKPDDLVRDGDELAFFPPITGG